MDKITNQWKKVVNKLSDIEILIQAATTHKTTWGPTTQDMDKIIMMLPSDRDRGIRYIFMTMQEPKSDWRTVYKCLLLIEYMSLNADEQTLDYLRRQIHDVRRMMQYTFRDSEGTDKGINIRKRAESVAEGLEDQDLFQKRAENQQNKSKYTQAVGSGFSGNYQSQSSSYPAAQSYDSGNGFLSQNQYPPQNSYQPQQNQFAPQQQTNNYAAMQPSNQFAPKQPVQNQYAPPQNQYAPQQQNQYAPQQQNQYAPQQQNQFAPQQQNQFAPQQNTSNQLQFAPVPAQNQYAPPPQAQQVFQAPAQQQQFVPQQQQQQAPQQVKQQAPKGNLLDDLLDF
ncbi:Epsin related protein [Spironucleus salmonicida]|uniref:EH domain binding protein epsin n=1 Tax=Spironucleus salmonicida TaxID=348837 RepID=V6LBL0_9EUKA|nr:Epsin related protein [Spironucleus salmonicida]|eukprot:EST41638.1 EH domain binding protein epsin [Spironucleus salmonicida]